MGKLLSLSSTSFFRQTSETRLILLAALFIGILSNRTFFSRVFEVYPVSLQHGVFLVSLFMVLVLMVSFLAGTVASKYTTKPVLIFLLILSAVTGYFMDSYQVVIDQTMLVNAWETNRGEAGDLITLKMMLYLGVLGILPSVYVWKVKVQYPEGRQILFHKVRFIGLCLVGMFGLMAIQGKAFASFFREHKAIRYYANPTYCLYSAGKFISGGSGNQHTVVIPMGLDAVHSATATGRKLVIFVVGESARADRFSLNGYERETNPLLQQRQLLSFKHFTSSGTSTAVSVPVMFSSYPRKQADMKTVKSHENVLDVLSHGGVKVLWRDNNSSSKGVADRVEYQDFQLAENNTIFDVEARDEGMLVGLEEYIDGTSQGDILIVLHQMGCHGPAYYKRYPKAFEKFTPVCESNQLNECTDKEIGNAYDNIIVYTDYFLSKTIDLLECYEEDFETALFYVSDHGESLGENGIYLHGFPYAFAPEAQTHVPAVLWFGENSGFDMKAMKSIEQDPLTHDNIFHTLLGLFEMETDLYDEKLDFLHGRSTGHCGPQPFSTTEGE